MTVIEFDTQLEQVRSHLSRFAFQLTANGENANDLLQETLVKALINRDKFREEINFKAWTFTIMRNLFINNYRKEQKYKRIDHEPDHFSMIHKSANLDSPEGQVTIIQLQQIIETLDEEFKRPLIMHIEGFKYSEIAEKLHLKMGTVKSRIFISRRKLASLLNDISLRHMPSMS